MDTGKMEKRKGERQTDRHKDTERMRHTRREKNR